jgi:hypothetical protein
MTDSTDRVFKVVRDNGLVLVQDKRAANVVALLTGETLKGSWWSHPKGQLIFETLSELAAHPDVLFAKLLATKVTLVHRGLWPALLAVVSAGEPWQVRGLSVPGRRLLSAVNGSPVPVAVAGPAAKELEKRLLVCTRETHTESGRHALLAESWTAWARGARVKPLRSIDEAKRRIEAAAESIGARRADIPWVAAS